MPSRSIGALRERLVVQLNAPPTLSVSSLTRTSTTATCTTATPHNYLAGDYATLAGSTNGWNAKVKVVTIPTPTTFTFTCSGSLTSPATGTITVTYTSNASGGQGANGSAYRTLDTIPAEMMALTAYERLQFAAIQSGVNYRFRVRVRADLTTTMRVLWIPSAPAGATRKTLVITGLPPMDDGRTWMFCECSEVAA